MVTSGDVRTAQDEKPHLAQNEKQGPTVSWFQTMQQVTGKTLYDDPVHW